MMKVRIDVERNHRGRHYTPLYTHNNNQWTGGAAMTLEQMRDYGEFLMNYAEAKMSLPNTSLPKEEKQ